MLKNGVKTLTALSVSQNQLIWVCGALEVSMALRWAFNLLWVTMETVKTHRDMAGQ